MAGLKSSQQRDAILDNLKNRYDHPTAETLYLDLKKEMPALSLATVYRNLKVLESEGLLIRIPGNDAEHYDGNFNNHYHLTCSNCKSIIDIEVKGEQVIDTLPHNFGGDIICHSLMYFGICPECKKSIKA